MTELAPATARMIAATNAGDSGAFIACFADDAYLQHWGRGFHGHDGVARWNRPTTSAGERTSRQPA